MKMQEALDIINGIPPQTGFVVRFERKHGAILAAHSFPDDSEEAIPTEEIAWDLAHRFAAKTRGVMVNIYVAHEDGGPVENYQQLMIENRR